MAYRIGQVVEGYVSGVQSYGVFVQLDKDTQGLIHISEITHGFVDDISESIELGQKVKVLVMDIDEYSKKISLSLRALEELPKEEGKKKKHHRRYGKRKSKTGFSSLEKQMPKWIEEGLEYIQYYQAHHQD